MSNDAKLGLVLGVAIVLVIALVFFRSDPQEARAPTDRANTPAAKQEQSPPTSLQSQLPSPRP